MATANTSIRLQLAYPPSWRERFRDGVAHNRLPLSYLTFALLIGGELALGLRPRAIGDIDDPLVAASLLMILTGLGVRSWAAGVLHKNRGLATTGPYRLCRHPLYLGSFLIIGGIGILISETWYLGLVLLLPLAAVYAVTVRREDERLATRLGGTWTAYAAHTACLLPSRWPKGPLSTWSLALWRRNRESHTQFCVLLGLAGLVLWRAVLR